MKKGDGRRQEQHHTQKRWWPKLEEVNTEMMIATRKVEVGTKKF